MSTLPVIVEPTTSVRDWLRTQSLVGANVWAGGLASPDSPTLPAIVVNRAGGTLNAPLDYPGFAFTVWATTASEAARVAGQLVTLFLQTKPRTVLDTVEGHEIHFGGVIEESIVMTPNPIPDPRYHRFDVTAQIVVTAVPA